MSRQSAAKKVFFDQLKVRANPALSMSPLETERWREYDFGGRVYRIENPVALYMRRGGTTHRILDANGTVHCVPAPGKDGCVLRWLNKNVRDPVEF